MNHPHSDSEQQQQQQRKLANLRTLQRVSQAVGTTGTAQEVTDIVATATHVVLYEFRTTDNTTTAAASSGWTKCQVEGSLFLVQGVRSSSSTTTTTTTTYHQLIILNRTSTENFVYTVPDQNTTTTTTGSRDDDALQIHNEDPFIILKIMTQPQPPRILGFWFHNTDERISFYQSFQSTLLSAKTAVATTTPTTTATTIAAPPPPTNNNNNNNNNNDDNNTATALAALSLKHVLGIGTTTATTTTTTTPIITTPTIAAAAATTATATTATATPTITTTTTIPPPLDKKSLQLSLLSLIQDDRFIDLIHSQYVKVVRARATKLSSTPPPPAPS